MGVLLSPFVPAQAGTQGNYAEISFQRSRQRGFSHSISASFQALFHFLSLRSRSNADSRD
jgi:hypothetical protein